MIRLEHLQALCDLGYNQQEARFLYFVATHSGYFAQRQFLDFTGAKKGWKVHRFTARALGSAMCEPPPVGTVRQFSTSTHARSMAFSTAITCAIAAVFRVS